MCPTIGPRCSGQPQEFLKVDKYPWLCRPLEATKNGGPETIRSQILNKNPYYTQKENNQNSQNHTVFTVVTLDTYRFFFFLISLILNNLLHNTGWTRRWASLSEVSPFVVSNRLVDLVKTMCHPIIKSGRSIIMKNWCQRCMYTWSRIQLTIDQVLQER